MTNGNMYYVYCSLILTLKHELHWNCYTVSFIYTIVPQNYTICGGIYLQINSLPTGGAVGVWESEVSPVTLYTKQSSAHKRCFIRYYKQYEMKMNLKTFVSIRDTVMQKHPHQVLILKCAVLNQAFSPPVNHSNFHRRDFIFVISHIQKNNFVVQTSRPL